MSEPSAARQAARELERNDWLKLPADLSAATLHELLKPVQTIIQQSIDQELEKAAQLAHQAISQHCSEHDTLSEKLFQLCADIRAMKGGGK